MDARETSTRPDEGGRAAGESAVAPGNADAPAGAGPDAHEP